MPSLNRVDPPAALFVEPDVGQSLADEMTGRDRPPPDTRRRDDDTVPPQQRDSVGFGQRVLFKGADNLGPLLRIGGDRLADIERIEKTVGRPRVIDRRQIVRNVFGQLDRRVVEIIAGEVERDIEVAGIDALLPIGDWQLLRRRRDPDLPPAGGQEFGAGVMRHRNVAHQQAQGQIAGAGGAEQLPGRSNPPTYLRNVVCCRRSAAPQRSIASDSARRTRASPKGGRRVLKTIERLASHGLSLTVTRSPKAAISASRCGGAIPRNSARIWPLL